MKKILLGTVAVILASSAASAQTAPSADGVMSLGLGMGQLKQTDCDSCIEPDLSQRDISADINVRFNQSLSVGFAFIDRQTTLSFEEGEGPSGEFDIDVTRWTIAPRYDFNEAAHVGVYMQDFTFEGILDLTSKGVFGGYDAGMFAFGAYAGKTELSTQGFRQGPNESGIDARNVGVNAVVSPTDGLELFAHYSIANVESDVEGPDLDGEIKLSGAGFEYLLDNGLSVYGATTSTQLLDSEDKIRQSVLGAGMDLSRLNENIPGVLSGDYTRTDYGFGLEQNAFAVNWTFGFGGADVRSQNCTVRNARGGNRAPLAATLECGVIEFFGIN